LQADVVHSNSGIIFTGAFGAFLAGVPHIWHIREWFGEFHLLWKCYSRVILRISRFVICVSRPIKDQFPPRGHLLVINDGFDAAEFDVNHEALGIEFRTRYKLGTELVVGVVGRIKLVRKGQEVLLQAADILERRGIRARYLIVGSPYPGNESHLQELHRLAEELSLSDRVVFTGELADPKPAYASMDIFVLPSGQPEPFGGVVMEAMAMGLPVVATNIGGSVDQVSEGITGFLIPPSDPVRLADQLELLISDEALRRKFGQAGKQRVASEFRLDGMVRKLEDVYAACGSGEWRTQAKRERE
jgi:glycosyltransferase involved in cell wall biosynthesis